MSNAQRTAGLDDQARGDQTDGRSRGSVVVRALLRAAVPIALVTLLAGYVVYNQSDGQPRVFEASSQVVLSASRNFAPIEFGGGGGEDRYVQNQANIMMTLPVLDRVAAALADGVPGSDLRGQIRAVPVGGRDVITVTAVASDPAVAARRADAVAVAYAQFTAEQVQVLADQAVQAGATDPLFVRDVRARAASFGDGVSVIEPATVPSEPVSPTPRRNAYLAAVGAFLLSAVLAVAWGSLRRPRGRDVLAADVGGPLLGEVPVRWFGAAAVPQQPGRADYGLASQALRYRLRDLGDQSVLLTAVGRDTSATSALLGLAAADAAQGRNVVIVDATPDGRLLRRAGASAPAVSLPTAVLGGSDLSTALEVVPELAGPHGGSVRVARVGRTPAATADLLRRSLTTLLDSADLVLVDAGAVVHDPAAFALVGEVGAVVAVVRAKHRGREVGELRRRLALAGRECDGVLVTRRTLLPALTLGSSEPAGRSVAPAVPSPPRTGDRGVATEQSATAGRPSS